MADNCKYCGKPVDEGGELSVSITFGDNPTMPFHQKCFDRATKQIIKELKVESDE